MEGQFAKIKEGKTRLELMKSDDSDNDIQEYIGDNEEEIPFD